VKPAAARIHDAVIAVLVHGGDVYLVHRQPSLNAFPGYHASPGGKVDAADGTGEALAGALFAGRDQRVLRALVRELREELEFDLAAAATAGEVTELRKLGNALTPSFVPVRFDAHIFRIVLKTRPDFVLHKPEAETGEWASPAEWMARYRSGRLLFAPPTRAVMQALAADIGAPDLAAVLDFSDTAGIRCVETVFGVRQYNVRSHTLPPAAHTNCFLLGDAEAHRILVDPSPESAEELERLLTAVNAIGFHEVFLTHHHPDHHQYADTIARRCNVPLAASADTQARIAAKQPRFFEGLTVRTRAEGDVVTHWLGQPVRAIAVPGHDEGQLALMPDNRAWCIVGDLIQGIGTVVIAPPEGNMRKYYASMQRVIDLKPAAIFPSHGPGLGGVHYLEAALAHRRQRETAIRTMHREGRSIDDMLALIYQGVDPRLLPLARINIESHLEKLREDGEVA
jgi:glyoxylase-like metal-dependent hydrolase (beta-lactamase superfamily II)